MPTAVGVTPFMKIKTQSLSNKFEEPEFSFPWVLNL